MIMMLMGEAVEEPSSKERVNSNTQLLRRAEYQLKERISTPTSLMKRILLIRAGVQLPDFIKTSKANLKKINKGTLSFMK